MTSDADFVLTIVVPRHGAYAQFSERHFYEPYVRRFETIVVLSDAMRPGKGGA